jgi:hypothetical protein
MARAVLLTPTYVSARVLGVPKAEAELQTAVYKLAGELVPAEAQRGKRVIVVPELELPYGRPDLVVAAVDLREWRRWSAREVRPCTAPGPLAAALVLQRLGGVATFADIKMATQPVRRASLSNALGALDACGLVVRIEETFRLRTRIGHAVAFAAGVEVKLNNWRRAARQAQSWEGKVDSAWLAFPHAYLTHVPRVPGLKRFGLIGVEGSAAFIVRRARGPRASVEKHVVLEQHIYRRWLEQEALNLTAEN